MNRVKHIPTAELKYLISLILVIKYDVINIYLSYCWLKQFRLGSGWNFRATVWLGWVMFLEVCRCVPGRQHPNSFWPDKINYLPHIFGILGDNRQCSRSIFIEKLIDKFHLRFEIFTSVRQSKMEKSVKKLYSFYRFQIVTVA